MNEEMLLSLHEQIWDVDNPQLLISADEEKLLITLNLKESYWEIVKHSNQGWAVADSQSDVLIFGALPGWGLYQNILRNPVYCFGSSIYKGHNPDLIRLTDALQQSLALLRTYPTEFPLEAY